MIPEREREALMRLTMCAREECDMCKYTYNCNFDFQRELATKNMNILADALRTADRKTEPSSSEKPNNFGKDINVRSKDERQTERPTRCSECKAWRRCFKEKPSYNMIKSRCPIDEPQTERSE